MPSVSQKQQMFFGMADAYKHGDMPDASPAIKKSSAGMTEKQVSDFASTKHKGLPEKVSGNALRNAVMGSSPSVIKAAKMRAKYPMKRKRA